MTPSNPPPEPFAHVRADTTTDDAQLAAFETDAAAEVALPADGHVVGEPVCATQIRYPGQPVSLPYPRHYEIGVAIGALSLALSFEGVLSWGHINNRPFLRCLHGTGISAWRLGDRRSAAAVFQRLLWLDPGDQQGARFNLADVEFGKPWEETQGRER